MLFSKYNLRWGKPPKYIDHDVIWEEMTPEQVELLSRKAHKMDLRGADMMMIAIGSAIGGKTRPTQLLDGLSEGDGGEKRPSKKELLLKKYGKWFEKGWDNRKLVDFLIERGYDPLRYYEPKELEEIEIERNNHGEKN